MTEPRSGPANEPGQPGGSGPPESDRAAGMGPGNTGQGNMGQGRMDQGRTGEGSTDSGGTGASSVGGPGQGPAGSGFDDGSGRRSGATSEGSPDTGSVTTAKRTSAQATVPQQYGRQADRGAEEGAMAGLGAGGILALAAGRAWPGVLAGGLGLIAVGVMLLVWPAATLTLVAILIGAAVLCSGLVKLYEGFTARAESGGMRAAYVVIGLLAVLAGLYLLRHHTLSLFLVAFVTGVYFVAHGVSDIGVAISANAPARALRAVLGVLSIAAGLIMIVWPAITLALLVMIVGAWLLLYGLVLCGLAFSLRKASKEGEAGTGGRARRSRRLAASAG